MTNATLVCRMLNGSQTLPPRGVARGDRWPAILRQKVEEERMVEARAEGSARAHAAWLVWYNKLQEARKKSEPFDEPPPEL